jgi:hypothetical protein
MIPDESARQELCKVISEAVGGWNQNTQSITRVADAILAAGYRKVQVGEREKILALIDYAENMRGSSMYCKVTTHELSKALGLTE